MHDSHLTPRERVQLALAHQTSDRVPVDFLATPEAWAQLRSYTGLPDDESILRYLGVDLRHPRLRYVGPPLRSFGDGSYVDPWGVTWSPVAYAGGTYYEVSRRPLADVSDAAQLADHAWPDPDWWEVDALAVQIAAWDAETTYAICLDDFGDPGGFFEITTYLRGLEQTLLDMALNPDIPFEIMRRVTDVLAVLAERVLMQFGERIDLIWTSDDIAHQHGMLMSLPMWRTLVFPHHERFNRRVHELGGHIMYHSDGSLMRFLPGLIEMGIDVLDVLQFSADGMIPETLKAQFGDRLCFHGGACVQQLLPRVDAARVEREMRHIVDVMGRDGGFILSPTHAVQVDTPPANILAIYAAAGSLLDHQPQPAAAASTIRARYGTAAPPISAGRIGQL